MKTLQKFHGFKSLLCLFLFGILGLSGCEQKDTTQDYEVRVNVLDKSGNTVEKERCNNDIITTNPAGEVGYYDSNKAWSIEFKAKPGDKFNITFDHPCGFSTAKAEITLNERRNSVITLKLEPKLDASITGIVKNPKGLPIAGVTVSGVNPITQKLESAPPTKEDGKFELPFKAGNGQQIELSATSAKKSWREWTQAGHHIEIRL